MDQFEPLVTVLQSLWPLAGSESQARQGGCDSNPLQVFSFLAFGLYLLNLAMGMKRRRRRDLDTVIGGQEGISPELEEKIHEMQVHECRFMA